MEFPFVLSLIIITYAVLAAFVVVLEQKISSFLYEDNFLIEIMRIAVFIIALIVEILLFIAVIGIIGTLVKQYYGH